MQRTKENVDFIDFISKFNDTLYFLEDKSRVFSTEDFYESCKDETLIEKLEDFWFYLPKIEENRTKYLELVCNEFDDTKYFDNWRYALIYYTRQGMIHYFEDNFMDNSL